MNNLHEFIFRFYIKTQLLELIIVIGKLFSKKGNFQKQNNIINGGLNAVLSNEVHKRLPYDKLMQREIQIGFVFGFFIFATRIHRKSKI